MECPKPGCLGVLRLVEQIEGTTTFRFASLNRLPDGRTRVIVATDTSEQETEGTKKRYIRCTHGHGIQDLNESDEVLFVARFA